ncbi:MAG: hypothetical protein JWO30_3124 [Fibrobacteres bacterium]|nr:hypothetical protein [Fibrobacterota bacterium]
MAKRFSLRSLGFISLWAADLAWSASGSPALVPAKPAITAPAKAIKPKAAQLPQVSGGEPATPGNAQGTVDPASEPANSASKPILADAFIAQTALRVYLNRPAAIFVYNSRGQQVYHLDSERAMEVVPLQGMSTGFVYLTVRTAQGEMTKKLVFTGK